MEPLSAPTLDVADAFLSSRLAHLSSTGRTLIVIGRCTVEYAGRASSTLEAGDRIVVVKTDGSLLVHNPTGIKPVNWQPPGCEFQHRLVPGELVLEARRRKPVETVRIRFSQVVLLACPQLRADADLDIVGTEFDIRDTLRARPDLVEPGFQPWAKERITERGPLDLYGEDARGRRVIIEVKRTRAGLAEATQLWRYVEKERTKRAVEVRGILIAPACSDRALALLRDHGLEYKKVAWDALQDDARKALARDQPTLLSYASQRREQTKKD